MLIVRCFSEELKEAWQQSMHHCRSCMLVNVRNHFYLFMWEKKIYIFNLLRVLMWLTTYDSCSSWTVINPEPKIHPKPTLLWDFEQWWALDSPIFLLCPPGLIRADESENTCALCTPQNVPQGDFFSSDTLFLYLLIPQFPSRTTDGSFCKWTMCFVLFFPGIPSL